MSFLQLIHRGLDSEVNFQANCLYLSTVIVMLSIEAHWLLSNYRRYPPKYLLVPKLGLLRFPIGHKSACFLSRISDFRNRLRAFFEMETVLAPRPPPFLFLPPYLDSPHEVVPFSPFSEARENSAPA
jgi:hypothetical protein